MEFKVFTCSSILTFKTTERLVVGTIEPHEAILNLCQIPATIRQRRLAHLPEGQERRALFSLTTIECPNPSAVKLALSSPSDV